MHFCSTAQKNVLPVSGGSGVEDVLFGREQRQAVGIKVDRSLTFAHDGKSFQTRPLPAASLFTGPDGFSPGSEGYQLGNSHSGAPRVEKQQESFAGSCSVGL